MCYAAIRDLIPPRQFFMRDHNDDMVHMSLSEAGRAQNDSTQVTLPPVIRDQPAPSGLMSPPPLYPQAHCVPIEILWFIPLSVVHKSTVFTQEMVLINRCNGLCSSSQSQQHFIHIHIWCCLIGAKGSDSSCFDQSMQLLPEPDRRGLPAI